MAGTNDRRSALETVKEASHGLRGEIAADLEGDGDGGGAGLAESSKQLLKFHGLYQQDDRDRRAARRREGRGKAFSFMIRSKIPGGALTAGQYLVHDDLATRHGNGTLRITTRQDIQLHGVLRGDVRAAIRGINRALITTLGACGDVVRNVMCCPEPSTDPVRLQVEALARELSDHLTPRTRAYHELWLDGDKVHDGANAPEAGEVPGDDEPLYGRTYLPRKFKIAVAHPGDNCTDVYTQDVGLVVLAHDGRLAGFNVLVGGGLGMTHTKPGTFPRLADPLAFVPAERTIEVVEQIVRVQRDHGDRADRRHARLKYLIHDRGLAWFRSEVERRLGWKLAAPLQMPAFEPRLHLGWQRQDETRWFLGLSVANGRVRDEGAVRLRSALRAIVERHRPGLRLTANQDVLLTDVAPHQRPAIDAVLREHGVTLPENLSSVRRHSMACPALPTCGLALAEAERALPQVIDRLERELHDAGLDGETITVRMTGCPNGCARPYVADIGIVGRSLDRYVVFVGGRSDGSRLNRVFADLVPADRLVDTLRPLFAYFGEARRPGESFGDFCHRVGIAALQAYAASEGRSGTHG